MSNKPTELVLSDEMVERAATIIGEHRGHVEGPYDSDRAIAREAITAAFADVPMTNYGIGLALQFFDLVICVKESGGKAGIPRAGVYASDGPDGFVALDHTIEARWSTKGERHISRLAFGELDAPEARRKAAGEAEA